MITKLWRRLRFTLKLVAVAYIASPIFLCFLCIVSVFGHCNPIGALLGGLVFPVPILGPFTHLFLLLLTQKPVSHYGWFVWLSALFGIILLPFVLAHMIKPNKTSKHIAFVAFCIWAIVGMFELFVNLYLYSR